MATSRVDLILHPVRMRLLVTLAHRQCTARQLSELLPDIPQATLYHHLGILTKAGLLQVVAERQTHGIVEKQYALANESESATLNSNELASASRADHLRYFTIFVASLLGDYSRYLQQEAPIDLLADGVGYREVPLYLSDEEFVAMATALNHALLPYLGNQPASDRRRRLFWTITFPDTEPHSESSNEQGDSESPCTAP